MEKNVSEALGYGAEDATQYYVDMVNHNFVFFQLIMKVSCSMGLDIGDRLISGAKKIKFLVNGPLPSDEEFPSFRDFEVCHHYLQTASR